MSILTPDEVQECMTAARKVMGEGRDLEGCFAAEIEAALLKKLSRKAELPPAAGCGYVLKYEKGDTPSTYETGYAQIIGIETFTIDQLRDVIIKYEAKLQELNLQYISDFGQLQEQKPDAIGCTCSVCGEWQRWTPSGMVCKNGHGGAPGVNQKLFTTVKASRKSEPTEVRLWDSAEA